MLAGTANQITSEEPPQARLAPNNNIRIPKNYSMSNLLSQAGGPAALAVRTNKARYSLDGNTALDFGNMAKWVTFCGTETLSGKLDISDSIADIACVIQLAHNT
jgi:hypothetical protein